MSITAGVLAQSPQKMSYQCVVRNASGQLVTNQAVGMKISILQGSETGTVVFEETYSPNPQTNANGLATVEIGSGTSITGTFTGIDWAAGPYFLRTETDPDGGTSYTIEGTSQLLSVPYALHATLAENVFSGNWDDLKGIPGDFADGTDHTDDADCDPANEIQEISLSGSSLSLSKGGGTVTLPSSGDGECNPTGPAGGDLTGIYPDPTIGDGKITSAKILNGTIVSADIADNAVNSSKIQDGSVVTADLANYAVSTDKIGNGAVTGAKIAQTGAASGQALKWNGTTWAPDDDAHGLDLPYESSAASVHYGSVLKITATGGYFSSAIAGFTQTDQGCGILGENNSGIEDGGNGVVGRTNTHSGAGVKGAFDSDFTDGEGWGVLGNSNATSGGGGVYGQAYASSGETYGVYGTSYSPSGYGVYGSSKKYGVYGRSWEAQGRATVGEATGTQSIGIYGKALADNSTGVWGEGYNYDFYANGPGANYGAASSVRWKENLTTIDHPVEKVMAIRGIYFDWDQEHGGNHDVGMIAEEVGKVLPEIVVYEENGVDASGLDYSKITPLLLEAIKAQQKEIENLKARLEDLEREIGLIPQ